MLADLVLGVRDCLSETRAKTIASAKLRPFNLEHMPLFWILNEKVHQTLKFIIPKGHITYLFNSAIS